MSQQTVTALEGDESLDESLQILRVAQRIYPDVKGGGPYHVYALSRDQAAMGHDVTVVTIQTDPSQPRYEERDGFEIYRYPTTVELLGNDISSGVANHLRRAEGYDVIHAHSHLYFSTNLAALKRQFDDVPLAITNHGLYSQNAPEWMFDLYLRTLGRWTFNQADTIFCYTEEDRERVRDYGVTAPIEVVPNGIDTERFTPEGPESKLIDHDGPVALFVGRLVEGKRPQDAIKAVRNAREQHPNLKLYICGDGPLREELERKTGPEAEFLGHVPYDEMPNVYRSADVMVLPSRAEGVPRTVLEAMASGVYAVTTALRQYQKIVDEGYGTTVPVEDTVQMGKAIARFLDSPLEFDLKMEDRDNYSWQRTLEQTTTVLRELV